MALLAERMERTFSLLLDKRLSETGVHREVGQFARTRLDELIRTKVFPSTYRRFVDGHLGVPEDDVKLNHGEIIYLFEEVAGAVAYTVGFLKGISPVRSGRFQDSWIVIVDGVSWAGSFASIPAGAVVYVTNVAPYTRRLEQGEKGRRAGRFMTEAARQAVRKKYPTLRVDRSFISLAIGPGRYGWQVPYIRKTAPGKGDPITYPAVRISAK